MDLQVALDSKPYISHLQLLQPALRRGQHISHPSAPLLRRLRQERKYLESHAAIYDGLPKENEIEDPGSHPGNNFRLSLLLILTIAS